MISGETAIPFALLLRFINLLSHINPEQYNHAPQVRYQGIPATVTHSYLPKPSDSISQNVLYCIDMSYQLIKSLPNAR